MDNGQEVIMDVVVVVTAAVDGNDTLLGHTTQLMIHVCTMSCC